MLLDADTAFFQSPMIGWANRAYVETGTLFFHDRISCDHEYLDRRQRNNRTHLEEHLSAFDVRPFQNYSRIPRAAPPPRVTVNEIHLGFAPSNFLLQSHSWNRRAGHQTDSSLLLWDKRQQPRATAILQSFIARRGGSRRPPSYGDKDLYFLACELAETAYGFSEYGVDALGTQQQEPTVLRRCASLHASACCPRVHSTYWHGDPSLLYANSDHFLDWASSQSRLARTRARPASLYPGRAEDRALPQECPFDVDLVAIRPAEKEQLEERPRLFELVERRRPSIRNGSPGSA